MLKQESLVWAYGYGLSKIKKKKKLFKKILYDVSKFPCCFKVDIRSYHLQTKLKFFLMINFGIVFCAELCVWYKDVEDLRIFG